MGGILSKPSAPSMPPVPKPTPTPVPKTDDPAIEEARRKEVIAARKAKGRAATLLTGGQGDMGQAPVQRKTLLGQ